MSSTFIECFFQHSIRFGIGNGVVVKHFEIIAKQPCLGFDVLHGQPHGRQIHLGFALSGEIARRLAERDQGRANHSVTGQIFRRRFVGQSAVVESTRIASRLLSSFADT